MAQRIPAEVFPPGEYINDELAARGWTQLDLADILGKSVSNVSDILTGKSGISPETAKGLGEAFGTSAEVWLRLDARFRLRDARATPGTELRSLIYSKAPAREMVKRQWIEGSSNPEVLAATICRFLGISSLEQEPRPFPHAARKATDYRGASPSQVAWLCRVAHLAPTVVVASPYTAERLPEVIAGLRKLVPTLLDIRKAARQLADHGIRFLIVEALPGSKIDGVCYWIDEHSPVIALSLRYGKLNNFWHTLFHEIGHVKERDGLTEAVIDSDLTFEEDDLPPIEKAANHFAVETLIPGRELEGFISRVGPAYSLLHIRRFADRIGVHPAVVIGQLAYKHEITWARFGTYLPNVREQLTSTALTDGWGHVLPPVLNDLTPDGAA